MILPLLLVILLVGGILAWFVGRWSTLAVRLVSLLAIALELAVALLIWMDVADSSVAADTGWLIEFNRQWIPRFGISFHLAADGLSILLVALTAFMGLIAVLCSWNEIRERVGFFHFNILWSLAGITGVFLAVDLFLFYSFWELMLIPMYLLIWIWGHENRGYAAMKFFIFTQSGGLIMFIAILVLWFLNGSATGTYSFDYPVLLNASLSGGQERLLMFGFLAAFLLKLPAVPLHNWLPDAHTEAPTAGSVILAGLLLKTGAYGILRFALPLFPGAAHEFQYLMMGLGVIGILYGAMLSFAQKDLKRLVAYTSVSHMGFVLLGIFAMNKTALEGAVLQMVCHAISTGALFVIAGMLQERLHTRNTDLMGGFWSMVPRLGGFALFFCLAGLGLPGLGNFIAEFLVLAGSYQVSPLLTLFASLGLILSAVYSLALIQRIFHGNDSERPLITDLSLREIMIMGLLMITILWLGFYPQPVFDSIDRSIDSIQGKFVTDYNSEFKT